MFHLFNFYIFLFGSKAVSFLCCQKASGFLLIIWHQIVKRHLQYMNFSSSQKINDMYIFVVDVQE